MDEDRLNSSSVKIKFITDPELKVCSKIFWLSLFLVLKVVDGFSQVSPAPSDSLSNKRCFDGIFFFVTSGAKSLVQTHWQVLRTALTPFSKTCIILYYFIFNQLLFS